MKENVCVCKVNLKDGKYVVVSETTCLELIDASFRKERLVPIRKMVSGFNQYYKTIGDLIENVKFRDCVINVDKIVSIEYIDRTTK